MQAEMDLDNAISIENAAESKFEDDGIMKDMDEKLAPIMAKMDIYIEEVHAKGKKNKTGKKLVKEMKKIAILNRLLESHVLQYIYNSVTQKTNDKKWAHLFRLYRVGKNFTEKYRKGISDALGRHLNPIFEGVDKNTRKAISQIVFKLDLPSLLQKEGKKVK